MESKMIKRMYANSILYIKMNALILKKDEILHYFRSDVKAVIIL